METAEELAYASSRLKRVWYNHGDTLFAVGMAGPALCVVAATLLFPLLYSFWTSLASVDPASLAFKFIGLANYGSAIHDPLFLTALTNTLEFAGLTIVGTVVAGLGIALVLNQPFAGRGLLRAVVVLPWAMSQVVVAVVWGWIFDGTYGVLNAILKDLGIIHSYIGWLSNPHITLYLVALAFVWSSAPFAVVIYLAALAGISPELYNAAKVDGAGAWRRFRYVTLPGLRYATLMVLIVASLEGLLAFSLIYTMTGGGPGTSTTVLSWLAYQITFVRLQLGEGAAMFYSLVFMMVGLAFVYIRWLYRPEHEGEQ